ncbi:MAG TPA: hypothetical protein V6C89_17245 [Drouetiella sp.]|jgi:hypothetical protein
MNNPHNIREMLPLMSILIATSLTPPVSAQQQQQRQLQHNPQAPVSAYNEPKPVNKVELPDLPEFTGQAKLEKGSQYAANDQIERSYAYVYQAREEASRIIDWYRSALTMYKWDLDSNTNKAIIATNPRTGNSCSIYCDNETAAGCKLHISYTFMQKQTEKSAPNY